MLVHGRMTKNGECAHMSRLDLFLFDRLWVVLDGVQLTGFRSAKAQALLAYLALESRRAHAREALATLFWPDESGLVSKQYLRQALYQLRQLLGESASEFLLVTRDTVQFNPESSYTPGRGGLPGLPRKAGVGDRGQGLPGRSTGRVRHR